MNNRNKVLLLGTFGCFALSSAAAAAVNEQGIVTAEDVAFIDPNDDSTSRYIIRYKEAKARQFQSGVKDKAFFSEKKADDLMRKHKVKAIKYIDAAHSSVAELNPRQLKALLSDPQVKYIESDPKRYLYDVITPMAQSTPYGITMVQANLVSDANAANTKVCIIDTGYSLNHADLPGAGVSGFAFSGHGSWSSDGNGHGTHVAGTMVALDNNNGVLGVLPSAQAEVHIVKIFNDSGNWTFASDLIEGIQSCQDAGAKVVNMSLGGGSASQAEQTAMNNFYADGMLLVAAAGNDGNTSLSYPASYDAVVSVAAVDSSRNLASFSQRNAQVELAGPGVAVNSTWNNGGYNSISGTSMASPHVAAVAALVWSNHPQCTATQIRSALTATAQDRGTAGRDNSFGFGIVQAKAATDYLTTKGCNGGGGDTPPTGGASFPNLSASTSNWLRGSYMIPAGVSTLTFTISGGSGDADLYVRYNNQPTLNQYNCRPYLDGNSEQCTINNPQAGTWHVGINAYSAFSGLTFSYSY